MARPPVTIGNSAELYHWPSGGGCSAPRRELEPIEEPGEAENVESQAADDAGAIFSGSDALRVDLDLIGGADARVARQARKTGDLARKVLRVRRRTGAQRRRLTRNFCGTRRDSGDQVTIEHNQLVQTKIRAARLERNRLTVRVLRANEPACLCVHLAFQSLQVCRCHFAGASQAGLSVFAPRVGVVDAQLPFINRAIGVTDANSVAVLLKVERGQNFLATASPAHVPGICFSGHLNEALGHERSGCLRGLPNLALQILYPRNRNQFLTRGLRPRNGPACRDHKACSLAAGSCGCDPASNAPTGPNETGLTRSFFVRVGRRPAIFSALGRSIGAQVGPFPGPLIFGQRTTRSRRAGSKVEESLARIILRKSPGPIQTPIGHRRRDRKQRTGKRGAWNRNGLECKSEVRSGSEGQNVGLVTSPQVQWAAPFAVRADRETGDAIAGQSRQSFALIRKRDAGRFFHPGASRRRASKIDFLVVRLRLGSLPGFSFFLQRQTKLLLLFPVRIGPPICRNGRNTSYFCRHLLRASD